MKRQQLISLVFIVLIFISVAVLYNSMDRLDYVHDKAVSDDLVELRFMSSWAGLDSKASLLNQAIQTFEEKYPHIKIIDESMYGEDFLFTLKANFASGNGPDVFGLWPGSDLELLIENKMIADLSESLASDEAWLSSFDPQAFEFLSQDKIYSLPFEIIYEGMYINKDLFEDFEVEIPRDFDGLKRACLKFKKHGIIPIAYNLTPEGSFIYQNMIVQLAGKDSEKLVKANGDVEKAYIEAMYHMKELYELGAFPRDAFTLDDGSRNMLFIDKHAAMIVQGSWFNSDALDESVGLIPFPLGESNKIIYGVGNGNFHMSQHTFEDDKKRQAALLFLRFLTSGEGKEIFSRSPSLMTSTIEENDHYLRKLGLDLINSADELVAPPDHFVNRNFWENVLIKDFPRMLEGELKPDEIWQKLKDY